MADFDQQKKQTQHKQQQLIEQATKAMYAIFRKARRHRLPVDIQLKLFDSLVLPFYYIVVKIGALKN